VRAEVLLSSEPLRMDYVFLRRMSDTVDDSAQTLRGLWPLLPRVSVVEYKSPGRSYRVGNLDRLWGYVHTYYADQRAMPRRRADGTNLLPGMADAPDVWKRSDLCAVLVVPSRTPSLLDDVEEHGLVWSDRGNGYWEVTGGLFALFVVEIDVVGLAEGDNLLHSMGHGEAITPDALRFWLELVGSKEADMSMQDMEGYDELMAKFLATLSPKQRLAGLAPEQVLAGLAPEQWLAALPPEQRLAGLDRDHQIRALPLEVLRVLPDDYVRSLSPDAQADIRQRLQRHDD
jgi:hypothetical protein